MNEQAYSVLLRDKGPRCRTLYDSLVLMEAAALARRDIQITTPIKFNPDEEEQMRRSSIILAVAVAGFLSFTGCPQRKGAVMRAAFPGMTVV